MLLMLRRLAFFSFVVFLGGCGGASSRVNPGGAGGFQPPRSPYTLESCTLDVALDPNTHRLDATATLIVARKSDGPADTGGKLYLELHHDLNIAAVSCDGAPVSFRRMPGAAPAAGQDCPSGESQASAPPVHYELAWPPPGKRPAALVIRYGGKLFQDVKAGEKQGEIHNFQVNAHVGKVGVYLGEGSAWYPRIAEPDEDGDPRGEAPLTRYEVTVAEVPGMVLVACGNRDGAKLDVPRGKRTTWRSPFPLNGMALAGGPHQVFQRQMDDVLVSVHVSEAHASFAPGLLDALEAYLRMYQPLIGKYPYAEFTYVENFFSSGFAFPGFTLMASQVVAMGPMGLQPGYLDHELLHNWWGNGVFLSDLDGNWCECLTSYCANYMRHVLEGRHEKARAQRRSVCYGLSRLTPDKDKPLARFGRHDGPGRFIGYQKGSMVFAMLAREVGADTLWRAFRRLSTDRLGEPTGWNHIRQAVEQESGRPLQAFFDRWVRGGGVPDIAIDEARYDQRARRLTVALSQKGDQVFDVTVPIRLVYEDGILDESVRLDSPARVKVIKSLMAPQYVELDPDFHVMRRVPLGDVMPTISGIGKSKDLVIVRSEADGDAYATLAESVKKRYEKAEDTAVRELLDTELEPEDLEHGHALLLGRACLAPAAREVLEGKPLSFGEGCFLVGDRRYDKPAHEVLCCVGNEHDPGGVICFYYGNSAADLEKAGVITFYGGNSLVAFEDGSVTERRDFEKTRRVSVETTS